MRQNVISKGEDVCTSVRVLAKELNVKNFCFMAKTDNTKKGV